MKTSEVLIGALEYIRQFNGQIFVIKLGGEVASNDKVLSGIAQDITLLNWVGIHPVVLHGGGKGISDLMKKFGKEPQFIEGLRVTDEETIDIVKMILGKVNTEIVAAITCRGGNAVGLSGKSGRLFLAEKREKKGIDLGLVGDIKGIHPELIELLIHNNYIPIISPIGIQEDGTALNINADVAASELAIALKASKLMILTDVKGVLTKEGELIKRLTTSDVDRLIDTGVVREGMIPKLNSCINALHSGVQRAHMIKATEHGILEEIFTAKGTGTMLIPK